MSDSIIEVGGEQYVKIADITTVTEIAMMCGVSTPAVSNWRARHEDFPLPFVVFNNQRTALFLKSEVTAWFAERIASGYAPEIKAAILARLNES